MLLSKGTSKHPQKYTGRLSRNLNMTIMINHKEFTNFTYIRHDHFANVNLTLELVTTLTVTVYLDMTLTPATVR